MTMTFDFLQSLYKDLKAISKTLVVKRPDLAAEYETTDTVKAYDLYKACVNGTAYFYSFTGFEPEILAKYVTPDMLDLCINNPNFIPEAVRPSIVTDQIAYEIANYIEQNNYYRMLSGLPDVDDHSWIFVTGYSDIPEDIPIHKLSDSQIAVLETRGNLPYIQTDNPTKKYLYFLGANKIDIITAHEAKPFDILHIDTPSNSMTKEMFLKEYYAARRYIMATSYNKKLFPTTELYDPIMGIMILALAMRNTLVPSEDHYLDFDEFLNSILESYGLRKYFERLPFGYKKRLVLALDDIISKKGTDGVLVDICKIFSYSNTTINRYYLVKSQPSDVDGSIAFTEQGASMYQLNFAKADIRDKEIDYSEENLMSYSSVVTNDLLWQLSDEELSNLKNQKFNTLMTKYIDIEAAYDLSQLTFEVCYFINMLIGMKESLIKLRINNMYSSIGYSDAFTMIIFLLSALAKRSGFDGNIVYSPAHVAEILKFNYGDIKSTVKAVVDSYELLIDVDGKLLTNFDFTLKTPEKYASSGDVMSMYLSNKALYDAIVTEMTNTKDYRKYIALSNAKDILFISAMESEVFTKSDNTLATTYIDMLHELDPQLVTKINECDDISLQNLTLYILEKLENTFNSSELPYLFMNTPNSSGATLSNFLRQAINIFKASSVQLTAINVFFYLGETTPIRIIDSQYRNSYRTDNEELWITDTTATKKTLVLEDYVSVADKASFL